MVTLVVTSDRKEGRMHTISTRLVGIILVVSALPLDGPGVAYGQQTADPDFDAKVTEPAFTDRRPTVLFDEAHFNRHTAGGSYKPFVDLISNDGFRITPNKEKFAKDTLAGHDILVIVSAWGAKDRRDPKVTAPAFTDAECDAVRDWVHDGGRLLLITDHPPSGVPSENLGERFGADMSKGTTVDPRNHEKTGNPAWLVFSRDNKLLVDHPITKGRNESEHIKRVITFAGQSLKGPKGSTAFLKLGDTAVDRIPPSREKVSAAGRAQGLALQFGKGRVVVLGEAGVLSAQVIKRPGREPFRFGMTFSGSDNRQLALNIMRWLAGVPMSPATGEVDSSHNRPEKR